MRDEVGINVSVSVVNGVIVLVSTKVGDGERFFVGATTVLVNGFSTAWVP